MACQSSDQRPIHRSFFDGHAADARTSIELTTSINNGWHRYSRLHQHQQPLHQLQQQVSWPADISCRCSCCKPLDDSNKPKFLIDFQLVFLRNVTVRQAFRQSAYSVSQKIFTPEVSEFFNGWWFLTNGQDFFYQNFTYLLYVHNYFKLPNFIQLSLIIFAIFY